MRFLANSLKPSAFASVAQARRVEATDVVAHTSVLAMASQIQSARQLAHAVPAGPTWIEFEFPDAVGDAMGSKGLPVLEGKAGVLFLPSRGEGGTVAFFGLTSSDTAVELGFSCGWTTTEGVTTYSEPTPTSVPALGAYVSATLRFAVLALHCERMALATTGTPRSFAAENRGREKHGKPPLIACEPMTMREGIGRAVPEPVGWYAVVNEAEGIRYVARLHRSPESLRPMLDAVRAQIGKIVEDSGVDDAGKLAFALSASGDPMGEIDPYAECLADALGSRCFGVVARRDGTAIATFDDDVPDPGDEPPRQLVDWMTAR